MERGRSIGFITCAMLALTVWCDRAAALPDHPIITEVYSDPPGDEDGPVHRPPGNEHQGFIEIYIPPASALDPLLDADALRLTFYEVEGDSSSSGTELVNYRFDLPTFGRNPSTGAAAVSEPATGRPGPSDGATPNSVLLGCHRLVCRYTLMLSVIVARVNCLYSRS